jgi:hypothetical protein
MSIKIAAAIFNVQVVVEAMPHSFRSRRFTSRPSFPPSFHHGSQAWRSINYPLNIISFSRVPVKISLDQNLRDPNECVKRRMLERKEVTRFSLKAEFLISFEPRVHR